MTPVRRRSLAARLARGSMGVVVVCLFLVGAALLALAYDGERRSSHRLLAQHAEKVALLVSTYVDHTRTSLALVESTAGRVPPGAGPAELAAFRRDTLEAALLAPGTPLTQLALLDASGQEVTRASRFHAYLPSELVSRAEEPAFLEAREGRPYLSPVHLSKDSGLLSIQLSVPFHALDLQGVLVAEANLSKLWMEVSRLEIGRGGYAYLVDERGRFLAYQRFSEVLRHHGKDMRWAPPVAGFVAGAGPLVHDYVGFDGAPVLGVAVPIPRTAWAAVVELPRSEAFESSRRMAWLLGALGLFGVAVAGAAGLLVSRRLLRPITALTAAARRIGEGDLKTPVACPPGDDEVGALAHAFQAMQGSLERQVAERAQAQAALAASEERYRTIFESGGSALAIIEADGRMGMVNREFGELSGREPGEVPGRPFLEFVREEDRARLLDYHRRRGSDPTVPQRYEFGLLHRDGTIREVAVSVVVLPADRRLAALMDITSLRRAERERERSERQFRAIFDGAFEMVGLLDPVGTLLEANRRTLELSGVEREALVGRPFWEIPGFRHSPEQQGLVRQAVGRAALGEFVRFEASFRDATGALRAVDQSLTPVRDGEGRVVLLIPEGRDVTELREQQEQLRQSQKMESIGRLAGGVAHDFNNLLTAIYGNLEMALVETPPEDPRHPYLQEVKLAAESAARLTTQLLAFSRKQRLEPRLLDLNERIGSFATMVGRLLGERVRLRFERAASPCRVKVDPSQIEQIVFNLAVNARDAMPQGGTLTIALAHVTLDASACASHPRLAPGAHVALSVTDTGVGMPPELLSRIFEPFFTTKPAGQGTGLGLAIVQGAMEQAGGSLEVRSEPGKGTTFRLLFPRQPEPGERPQGDERAHLPRGHERVLMVEDNALILDTTRRILETLGYTVLTAPSAEAALALAARPETAFDLLLTDVVLPGLDGPGLARRLQESRPGLKVLFTSGYNENMVLAEAVRRNRVHFLPKPYTAQRLATAVRLALEEPAADG